METFTRNIKDKPSEGPRSSLTPSGDKENCNWSNFNPGDPGIIPLGELRVLKKQPLDNYFDGTKEKKDKKKARVKKTKWSKWSNQLPQAESQETWSPSPWGNFPKKEKEDTIEDKDIEYQIYKLMEEIEYNNRQMQIQQKAAEEAYIEEQTNLADTWMGVLRRRQQLNQIASHDGEFKPKPFYKERNSRRPIGISIISRRIWPEDEDQTDEKSKKDPSEEQKQDSGNTEKPSHLVQNGFGVDELSDEFLHQLVFVDEDFISNN